MSKPAVRDCRAARAQSACTRRMSRFVIARGTSPGAKSLAICEGAAAARRDSLFSPCAPVCESSMPASAPCLCASSQVAASTRTSRSSHMRADTYGVSSDSWLIAQYSVLTAAQPPSALTRAVTRLRPGLLGAEARAVRHLVEAVAQRLGADAQRLEEHVVTRIATHVAGA